MCSGVLYECGGREYRSVFTNPRACLPVLLRCGKVQQVAWGRRQKQNGILPIGGWARHESIVSGRWDRYFPKPVKIVVSSFMEKDFEGRNSWYDMPDNGYLQGLLARDGYTLRAYIVTVEPSFEDEHERMPRIIYDR